MSTKQFTPQTCTTLANNQQQREALVTTEMTQVAALKDIRKQIADVDASTYATIRDEDPDGTIFAKEGGDHE